jgi:hypothetical protein
MVGLGFYKIMRIRAGLDPDPQDCAFPNIEVGIRAFRDKFPACLLHVGRQDDQELHQEFILAAKGLSLYDRSSSLRQKVCLFMIGVHPCGKRSVSL